MSTPPRPPVLFDREAEWSQLVDFLSPELESLRLGVLYGRRRQGKSEILRHLCDSNSGFYTLALEQHARSLALQRFADGLAEWAGLPSGMQFANWENALETAIRMAGDRATGTAQTQLIVIDELPFLMAHSPEIPGVLQALYERYGATRGGGNPPVRVILCGSALSVMSQLLGERQALYGRAQLNICLTAFDHIDSATFWGVADPETAFRLHAVIGGVPGYKELTAGVPVPDSPAELDRWLEATVFNPSHALFDEVDLLFSQEPGIKDRGLYYGVLAAIARGESTPAKIAARLERDSRTMSYPLSVLRRAGFVAYDEDALRSRKPIVSMADPIMRFHHTITIPRLQLFQRRGMALQAWEQARPTFSSQILGPHFEHLAREWTITTLSARVDRPIGWTGTTTVPCREHGINHQVDVISLVAGHQPRTSSAEITLIGEAKFTSAPRGASDLARLSHIRDLLGARAEDAALAIFSRMGFSDELSSVAHSNDTLLITLQNIYER